MSKNETALTIRYWGETGGTLIEEFRAVNETKDQGNRWIDGVIVRDDQNRRLTNKEYDASDIEGKDIIVVQTKIGRVRMSLLGQALFSKKLMERFNPKTIKTVAVCERPDAVLSPIAEEYDIKVKCYSL